MKLSHLFILKNDSPFFSEKKEILFKLKKLKVFLIRGREMMKLITHHGKFHADDVFSTAWLKKIYGEVEVIRIDRNDVYKYQNNDECFIYDIGNGKYDHHSKECREHRSNGDLYASFGKIVRDTYDLVGLNIKNYQHFDKYFVSPIDVVDNEGPSARISQHSDVVRAMNKDDLYGLEQAEAFNKAVSYAGFVLDVIINKYIETDKLESETKVIASENRGKDFVVLDKYYPINPFKKEGIKFIVYRDYDHWNCNSTDQINFNISDKITDNLIFRHGSGSFASFWTKDAAINAAEISLNLSNK